MSKKNFIILVSTNALIVTILLAMGIMKNNRILIITALFLVIAEFLHVAYLCIIKKNLNIFAGMTEEMASEIRKNPQELAKYEREIAIFGYVMLVGAIPLIYTVYKYIMV